MTNFLLTSLARELRRALDQQLARSAAFKGRAVGGEGTATAAGTTAAWTCGSLAAVAALSCVLYACFQSMATDWSAFSGTPALSLSQRASPLGAPGCTNAAMAGNCTGVVCLLCPTVLCPALPCGGAWAAACQSQCSGRCGELGAVHRRHRRKQRRRRTCWRCICSAKMGH